MILFTVHCGDDPGRWEWVPALEIVQYTPKGARRPSATFPLTISTNDLRGAMRKALREEARYHQLNRITT